MNKETTFAGKEGIMILASFLANLSPREETVKAVKRWDLNHVNKGFELPCPEVWLIQCLAFQMLKNASYLKISAFQEISRFFLNFLSFLSLPPFSPL